MIRYRPILARDTRDVDQLNDIYTAIELASVSVVSDQWAEEGLNPSRFDDQPVGFMEDFVTETTRMNTALAAAASFTSFTHGATAMRTGALAALAADQALRIRSRVWCATSLANGRGYEPQAYFRLRHVYDDGGAAVEIDYSRRGAYRRPAGTGLNDVGFHGVLFQESWLFGPIATIDFVELQYTLATAGVHPTYSGLWVTRFNKIEAL